MFEAMCLSRNGDRRVQRVEIESTYSEIANASPKPSYVKVPLIQSSAREITRKKHSILASSEFIDDDQRVL